jgi:uncharacterized membrane protein YeaQ/YmgE (transglycosylase-associated protein family)
LTRRAAPRLSRSSRFSIIGKGAGHDDHLAGLVLLIIIAALCGASGRAIAGEIRGGFIVSTAVGFVGALLGPWVAAQLRLAEPLVLHISGHPFPDLWSITALPCSWRSSTWFPGA